jgi:hypothetical protein
MRRALLLLIAVSFAAAAAPPLSAQAAIERPSPLMLPSQLVDEGAAVSASSRSFLASTPGRLMLGSAIGGWLGYFASHVAASDWKDASSNRLGWAAGGVVLGAVTGLFTTINLDGGRRAPSDIPMGIAASARGPLERDEIRASHAPNAYELVRSLRKEWLMPRGINSFTESARGFASMEEGSTVVAGADHILVYLNNSRMGGTQTLQEVSLAMIDRIEFIPGPQATFRWGTGHAHGVILLTTLSAEQKQ